MPAFTPLCSTLARNVACLVIPTLFINTCDPEMASTQAPPSGAHSGCSRFQNWGQSYMSGSRGTRKKRKSGCRETEIEKNMLKGRKGWIKRHTEMEADRMANRYVTERKSTTRNLPRVFSLPISLFFFFFSNLHIHTVLSFHNPWLKVLLGGFAEMRKATMSFFIFVRPSVRMEQLGSHWTNFHEIWYLNIFNKIWQE